MEVAEEVLVDEFIDSHIKYIRRMASLTDEQLMVYFRLGVQEHPEMLEQFKENKMKKALPDITKDVKDIGSGGYGVPRKWARKVDEYYEGG